MHVPSPLLLTLALLSSALAAQETATPNDVTDERAGAYALVGATVTTAPGSVMEGATVLVRDGEVVRVLAAGTRVPEGYAAIDYAGRWIYPGLVDVYTSYGLPDAPKRAGFSFNKPEVLDSQKAGAYNANEAIKSEYRAADHFTVRPKDAAAWRGMGFGAVLTFMADGIARGSGALVTLGEASDNEAVLVPDVAAMYSFDKGSSKQAYPISAMGTIALLRQTYLDALWYTAQREKPFTDLSLEAWTDLQPLPQIFETQDWLSTLRADMVGDEFNVQYVIRESGDAYQRLEAVKATGATLIVPVGFPAPQDVEDPFTADYVSYRDLKHWEMAPGNLAALEAAGVSFAITSGGDTKQFWGNLRTAIERGLSEERALAALTTVPAQIVRQSSRLGQLQPGALANLIVSSAPLFDEDAVIEENWVAGTRYRVAPRVEDRSGVYVLNVGGRDYELRVAGKPGKAKGTVVEPAPDAEGEETEFSTSLSFDNGAVTLSFSPGDDAPAIRLGGWIAGDGWAGEARLADGATVNWFAVRKGDLPAGGADDQGASGSDASGEAGGEGAATADATAGDAGTDAAAVGDVVYPFNAYGTASLPQPQTMLIRGATLWTLEGAGLMETGDIVIRDGRIAAVGRNLSARDATVIDGTGLHVTPGIIDEHSHIALSAVNDFATNAAMVRMNDVVDSEDINIYRNLAGGVVAAQLLHGSANPIGGQSALVKMRWGRLPREMLIEGADGFIKFALGENVKRSRNEESIRYPQTRMGVEQVYRDAFSAARGYQAEWAAWNNLGRQQQARTPPPRRDLVMDAMVEILDAERFITCHSYVQSEINMLMHVADDFDVTVNTFTHILEGYKVADRMAAHGAAGSTFSDWWAYKWEVRYAIPYNAALMTMAGVNTAINSDSAEMSRRLNQEAAKSVKYGGMSEVEALKMVTLNPAKMLHLDERMGSLKAGKDADVVIWSDHPLSIEARVMKTIVDGTVYYDATEQAARHMAVEKERARLIEKMRRAKQGSEGGGPPGGAAGPKPERLWQCDSVHGYEYLDDHLDTH